MGLNLTGPQPGWITKGDKIYGHMFQIVSGPTVNVKVVAHKKITNAVLYPNSVIGALDKDSIYVKVAKKIYDPDAGDEYVSINEMEKSGIIKPKIPSDIPCTVTEKTKIFNFGWTNDPAKQNTLQSLIDKLQ